jgi:hypothetical protein
MDVLWQTDDETLPFTVMRNDGSAVFFWGDWGHESAIVRAARFYDRWGKLSKVHRFPEKESGAVYATGDSTFALCTSDGRDGWEVSVFDTRGRAIWHRTGVGGSGLYPRKIAVSDECHVVLPLSSRDEIGVEALVFDGRGLLRGTLQISESSSLGEVQIYGRKTFLTLAVRDTTGLISRVHLVCYDLDEMTESVVHKTAPGRMLRYLRGDAHAGLVAVYEYELVPGQTPPVKDGKIRVFSIDGDAKASVALEPRIWPPCWFKVLPGGLLVVDENKLKLYEIK